MTDIDKLNHIKLHCLERLEISYKRTPGAWWAETPGGNNGIRAKEDHVMLYKDSYLEREDAAFIATCAGNAEAGWRATIHGINTLLALYKLNMKLAGHRMMQIAGPARQNLTQIRSGMSDMVAPWNELLFSLITNPTTQPQ